MNLTSLNLSSLLPLIIIVQPSLASNFVSSLPIPVPPPVIQATFDFHSSIGHFSKKYSIELLSLRIILTQLPFISYQISIFKSSLSKFFTSKLIMSCQYFIIKLMQILNKSFLGNKKQNRFSLLSS